MDKMRDIRRKVQLMNRSTHRMQVALSLQDSSARHLFMKRECRLQLKRCVELLFLLYRQ